MSKDQCQAMVHRRGNEGDSRCMHAAHHRVETAQGGSIRVCDVHRRVLLHRRRLGSDEEVIVRWLATPET